MYLLKVAHHGSRYSTGASFLDDVDPRLAVICMGPNSYGHPTPETIRRLRASGARVYATQKNGTITVTIAPSGKAAWSFSRRSKPVTGAGGFGNSSSTAGGSSGSGNATAGGGTIVFVTETGECYHRGTCQYLSQSKIKISLKNARAQNYRPCSVCDPRDRRSRSTRDEGTIAAQGRR